MSVNLSDPNYPAFRSAALSWYASPGFINTAPPLDVPDEQGWADAYADWYDGRGPGGQMGGGFIGEESGGGGTGGNPPAPPGGG